MDSRLEHCYAALSALLSPMRGSRGRPAHRYRSKRHNVVKDRMRLLPQAPGNIVTLGVLALVACSGDGNEPPPGPAPPYLAIVTRVDAAAGVFAGDEYRFRVREQSGTLGVDTTLVAPSLVDTLILSVPNQSANYEITIEGVPDKCASRYGDDTIALVPANSNTTLVRYFIICRPLIQLFVQTDGVDRDDGYLYRLTGPGVERVGQVSAQDTLLLEDLAPGWYRMDVGGIASNCTPISNGLDALDIEIPAEGGVSSLLRIACSDPSRLPSFASLDATYAEGWVGVAAVVADPDGDLDNYTWDVTDCRGHSTIGAGTRSYRGILANRGSVDTVVLPLALEVGEALPAIEGHCLAMRVFDRMGNSSAVKQVPLRPNDPSAPLEPGSFNARITQDQAVIRTAVAIDMSSPRVLGLFPTVRFRDGILAPPDGNPDTGIYGIAGYVTSMLPDVRLGGRFQWYDVLAVELYVVDRRGNLRRLRDDHLLGE